MTVIPPKLIVRMIKRELLESFGRNVRFSVRSGFREIRVTWVKGPSAREVRNVVKKFDGADFDSATDTWIAKRSVIDGKTVQLDVNYISCEQLDSLGF